MFCVLCLFIASLSKAANRRAIKMAPIRERALKRATKLTMVTVTASMIINPITFQNNKPFSSISSPSAGSFLFACRTRRRVTGRGRGRGKDRGKRGRQVWGTEASTRTQTGAQPARSYLDNVKCEWELETSRGSRGGNQG